MKKIYNILILGAVVSLIFSACNQDYIDAITKVDPGSDESAPTVSLHYPNGDIIIPFTEDETDIEFSFSVSDDIELQEVSIILDGTELVSFDEFVDYRSTETTFLSTSIEIGEHSVSVVGTDKSGKSTTVTLDFEVANQYVAKENEVFFMPFEGGVNLDLITETAATSFGTGFTTGISGQAMNLDGTNQNYALFPGEVLSSLSEFTVSFWTKSDFVDGDENGAIDGMHGMIGLSNTGTFWGNWHMFIENGSSPTNGGDVRIHTQNGIAAPTYSETWINPDNISDIFSAWVNHVLVYDDVAKEFRYYVNGSLFNTSAASWSGDFEFANSGQIVIGCAQFMTNPSLTSSHGAEGWAGYFSGQIDEIRIFSAAYSDSQVSGLYTEVAGE